MRASRRNRRYGQTIPAATLALALSAIASTPTQAPAGDTILQYFEGRWETIERRMPDVFVAGYDAMWVPPPSVADSGGFSVGYDVFDRFNLGQPFWQTLYGTTQGFDRLSDEMDQVGINLYIDTVLNHNGFSDQQRPGFVEAGDYPGFIVSADFDPDGDFHSVFDGGDLNGRLSGLIDIAHDKNYQFTRHPAPDSPNPIPFETPTEANRALYPDRDLPQEFGRHPFNLENPMAGDPVQENATGLLMRWVQYMVEVHGVDGFRLDAVKHSETFLFNDFFDPAVFNLAIDPLTGDRFTPFSFGEALDGSFDLLNAYTRKDGFGNRDVLDFPLFFTMRALFDGNGFGSMRSLEFSSFDSSDGNANDGTRGVMFANSHDDFGGGFFNGLSTIPHAHILTRPGFPIVYYNAKEFGDGRDFPKDGRGDAIGNFGSAITTLVQINDVYGQGSHFTRWIDDDVYIYERENSMMVGLTDNGLDGFEERWVDSSFPPGTVLREQTGNHQADDNVFEFTTVQDDGRVNIRIPQNGPQNEFGSFEGRGYVVYAPEAPRATLSISNAESILGPDPVEQEPESTRRLTSLPVVTEDTIEVSVSVDGDGPVDDNALIRLNRGGDDLDGDDNISLSGFRGFESFTSASSTASGGDGSYSISIDATDLEEGYNYIETITFLQRDSGPAIFDSDRTVVYLDRQPPAVDLLFPQQTGEDDILSRTYEVAVSVDRTVDNVHILLNVDPGLTDQEVIGLLTGETNAFKRDRLEWRRVINVSTIGPQEITVVAFEETGTSSVTRFGGIDADLSFPELEIGIDADPSPDSVDFQPLPNPIEESVFDEEIVVRVNTNNTPEGPVAFGDGDFSLTLTVDDGEPLVAQGFDGDLLPPVGILVQNDQNIGDDFDEFRFVWRGFSPGQHRFQANAELTDGSQAPTEAVATTFVPDSVPGPMVTLTTPNPDGSTVLNNPSEIVVAGSFDEALGFAQVFISTGQGLELLGTFDDPDVGPFELRIPVASFANSDVLDPEAFETENGVFDIIVQAFTGVPGEGTEGIQSETSAPITIEGQEVAEPIPSILVDGDGSDSLRLPALAVSAADGGTGDGPPADFGPDGTVTELHAGIRENALGLAIRGDFFGDDNLNESGNALLLLIDVDYGTGSGAINLGSQLSDGSDGTRAIISSAAIAFSDDLIAQGAGIDLVVGIRGDGQAFGYSLGTGGLPGAFDGFEFNGDIAGAFISDVSGVPAAPGTSYAAPDAYEFRIPLASIGDPDPNSIGLAVVAVSDAGFPNPNTLPENSSDAFDDVQLLEALATFGEAPADVVINELAFGDDDRAELFSKASTPTDLSGWSLILNDSGNIPRAYTFDEGTMLSAGKYLVLSDGASTATGALYFGFNVPWDPNRGGSVALVDSFGIGVDYVEWRDVDGSTSSEVPGSAPAGTAWNDDGGAFVAAAENGNSIGRDSLGTDTDAPVDWSTNGGVDAPGPTFGAVNDPTGAIMRGDANGDGDISPLDAMAAFQCYLTGMCSTLASESAADVYPDNGDGCIGIGDGNAVITPGDAARIFSAFLGEEELCF